MAASDASGLGGLSSEQLEQLLGGDWRTHGPLRLNWALPDEDLARSLMLENARRFLATLGEAGQLPADAEGGLHPSAVDLLFDRLKWDDDTPARLRAKYQPVLETDFLPIRKARVALQQLGLVVPVPGGFRPAPEAAALCEPHRAAEFFALLFRATFRDLDHSLIDPEDPAPEVHRHAAYSLWVLWHLGRRWLRQTTLLPLLLPARVRRMKLSARRGMRMSPAPTELLTFRLLGPLTDFGVLECRTTRASEYRPPVYRFRATPLFRRFIRFDFGPEPPVRRLHGWRRNLRLIR